MPTSVHRLKCSTSVALNQCYKTICVGNYCNFWRVYRFKLFCFESEACDAKHSGVRLKSSSWFLWCVCKSGVWFSQRRKEEGGRRKEEGGRRKEGEGEGEREREKEKEKEKEKERERERERKRKREREREWESERVSELDTWWDLYLCVWFSTVEIERVILCACDPGTLALLVSNRPKYRHCSRRRTTRLNANCPMHIAHIAVWFIELWLLGHHALAGVLSLKMCPVNALAM